eukprot:TRINITY_DN25738_c0_g1_i1.p1 TRINITY_DN25738_c0_g1~~TRINITY_DN25738_c0_g1_i1.p1  ORF type:complete len:275 (+),score=30.91 TRINITY_DN25738_c0_g1_i1:151-975(+)
MLADVNQGATRHAEPNDGVRLFIKNTFVDASTDEEMRFRSSCSKRSHSWSGHSSSSSFGGSSESHRNSEEKQQDASAGHTNLRSPRQLADQKLQSPRNSPETSAEHVRGTCRPCHFVTLPDGCKSGRGCNFCHHPDHSVGASARRPTKAVRKGYKKLLEQIRNSDMSEEEKAQALEELASKSGYVRYFLNPEPKVDDTQKDADVMSSGSSTLPCKMSSTVLGKAQTPDLTAWNEGPRVPGHQAQLRPDPTVQKPGLVPSRVGLRTQEGSCRISL